MRMSAWITLLLLLASIGCRSSAKKMEEDTLRMPAEEAIAEAPLLVPGPVVEAPAAVVEVAPSIPLTPEEEVEIAQLEARIVELERALADGKKELQDTLTRLRTNRERRLGRIRADLNTAVENFDRDLDEVRIVKGGEHHGE